MVMRPSFSADDLQYDIQDQRNAATFKQLIWQTRSCMNEGAQAMLVQGARDSSTIATFVQNTCGNSLAGFMGQTLQRPTAEVGAFIQAMAYDELNQIPGLSRPGSAASPLQRPEKSTAFIISTFKNGQPMGTRKTEAAEFRNAAIGLVSTFQDKTPSYERLVSVAKSMAAKDRCFNLLSSKFAIASVEAGIVDASQNAEMFLKNSVASLEAVNSQNTSNVRDALAAMLGGSGLMETLESHSCPTHHLNALQRSTKFSRSLHNPAARVFKLPNLPG